MVLTVDGRLEDLAFLHQHGSTVLRRVWFLHITKEAIKRYVQTLNCMLVFGENGSRDTAEVAFVTGISERLAGGYLDLRRRYSTAQPADRLKEILNLFNTK